jgi:predicted ATPase
MSSSINNLTIKGFKSIRNLEEFELRNLNVFIGANGSGKSNFIEVFRMLSAMVAKNFSRFIKERGGADSFLHEGPKVSLEIELYLKLEKEAFKFKLSPTVNEDFFITELEPATDTVLNMGDFLSGMPQKLPFEDLLTDNLQVYHFHDTSSTSPMRRSEIVEDNFKLRGDASNIAPFLLHLRETPELNRYYREIVNAVRLVNPFFDEFRLDILQNGEARKVKLSWNQKGSDYPMQPYHLSDGSIRFICLATALLQPNPPAIIVIDEPELGLHPEAVAILAELIESASNATQVLIAIQSPSLINYFSMEDIVVVKRMDGQSTFERLNGDDFSEWLQDYSIGELWTKNVIAGGSTNG